MIFGLGCDVVEIERVAGALERQGAVFAQGILTEKELEVWSARSAANARRGLAYLAGRWAAKEAFAKAMGTGFRAEVSWRSIEVLNDSLGAPYFVFHSKLKEKMAAEQVRFFLSISDERSVAMAVVVAEK